MDVKVRLFYSKEDCNQVDTRWNWCIHASHANECPVYIQQSKQTMYARTHKHTDTENTHTCPHQEGIIRTNKYIRIHTFIQVCVCVHVCMYSTHPHQRGHTVGAGGDSRCLHRSSSSQCYQRTGCATYVLPLRVFCFLRAHAVFCVSHAQGNMRLVEPFFPRIFFLSTTNRIIHSVHAFSTRTTRTTFTPTTTPHACAHVHTQVCALLSSKTDIVARMRRCCMSVHTYIHTYMHTCIKT